MQVQLFKKLKIFHLRFPYDIFQFSQRKLAENFLHTSEDWLPKKNRKSDKNWRKYEDFLQSVSIILAHTLLIKLMLSSYNKEQSCLYVVFSKDLFLS